MTLPDSSLFNYKSEALDYPTETFLLDMDTGSVSHVGGGLEAMKQAVWFALNTERYAYQIYSPNFGAELNGLIGKPPEYVTSMLKRRIQETFSGDARILSVDDFSFDISEADTVRCVFQIYTVYGSFPSEVRV